MFKGVDGNLHFDEAEIKELEDMINDDIESELETYKVDMNELELSVSESGKNIEYIKMIELIIYKEDEKLVTGK